MKIEKIRVYQVDLPLKEAAYRWADGKSVSTYDSSVIEVTTDAGITGYGEVCPLGPNYLPSYAGGVRAGIKELGPQLLGHSPLELSKLNHTMDYLMKGHPYVKTGIDEACWDILGKFTQMPVCELLGGRFGESVELYRAISQAEPRTMTDNVLHYRQQGYRKFQLKLGGVLEEDILRLKYIREALQDTDILVGDANTGWLPHQALRLAAAVKGLDVYLEQPCSSLEECMSVRDRTALPMILDECVDGMDALVRVIHARAADVVNIKISRMGGLTKAKQARDLCVSMGIAMCLEDTWGGDITTSAIAHFAHSTPEKFRFSATDFNSYSDVKIATGAPVRMNGTMAASDKPGLGIEPIMEALGQPVVDI